MRNWKYLELDEISAIWRSFQLTESSIAKDECPSSNSVGVRSVRLTPLEIMRLVDNLLQRLDTKEKREEAREVAINGR